MSGYEVGQPQIIYGEPVYGEPMYGEPMEGTPTSIPGPPQAPPSSEEYYIPPRPDTGDADVRNNAGHRSSTLPTTLVVPARL